MIKRKRTTATLEPAMSGDAGTASYTTRLTAEQRAVIDRAAGEIGWSPAKFIREAAVTRAADVVNASGAAKYALRQLAEIVLQQMISPMLREQEHKRWQEAGHPDELEPTELPVATSAELYQVKQALESSGSEFVRMMLEQWDTVMTGGGKYQPTVSAADLLKGGDE